MEFQGKVIQVLEEITGVSKAGNPWKKKEWIVETFDQYPKKIKLQCFGNRCETIILEAGHDYRFFIDLESREYQGRWYTEVNLFRAEEIMPGAMGGMPGNMVSGMGMGSQPQPGNSNPGGSPNQPYGNTPGFGGGITGQEFTATVEESDEDLPF